MRELLFVSQAAVRSLLDIDELFEALARALRHLSEGRASVPARVGAFAPAGLLGAMPGYLPDAGLMVKLVSVFPANRAHDLPSHQALIGVFDADVGTPLAIMDGIHITAARTAATSAVAARALARPDARVLAILGAGAQGAAHLDAFGRIADFDEIRVASRTRQNAVALAARDPRAMVADSPDQAVRGADVVCCCTDAREAVLQASWLAPGTHVGSVGTGAELDHDTMSAAAVFVEWRGAVTNPPPAGAVELQGRDPDTVTEVGEVLGGTRPGRQSEEELTVYKSTGHAVEDAAAAALVYREAIRRGIGTAVDL